MTYDLKTSRKWLTKEKLQCTLNTLPAGTLLECNQVKNLLILKKPLGKGMGFIDFVDGNVEYWDESSSVT